MNPFALLEGLFQWFFARCYELSWDIDRWPIAPDFLVAFFQTMGEWCWDVSVWFRGAASWWQEVTAAIARILTVFDIENLISGLRSALSSVWSWWVSWWDNVGARISSWWSGVQYTVRSWIAVAVDGFYSLVKLLQDQVDAVATWWDDFTRDTLPSLLSLDWVGEFFGQGIAAIADWWSPKHAEVSAETEAVVQPVRDTVNEHSSWLEMIKELFTDPAGFFLRMIERMVVELW